MEESMKKIALILGSTTIDQNTQNGVTYNKIGGVTTYGGFTLQNHGISTTVVTNISPRDKFIVNFFINNDIQIKYGYSDSTTKIVNINSGDNREQMIPTCALPITLEQVQEFENVSTVVYLGPLHPSDISESVFNKKILNNKTVCLDIQGYVRKIVNGRVEKSVSDRIEKALIFSDVVKAENTELELVMNHYDLTLPELLQRFNLKEIIVTSGKSGGYVLSNSLEKIDFQPFPVDKVIDPTGAGDVFFATYIASRIYNNLDINSSCIKAAFMASSHISGNYIPQDMLTIRS